MSAVALPRTVQPRRGIRIVMPELYDQLEKRDPADRERAQMASLPAQLAYAKTHTAAYQRILYGVDV